MPRNKERGFSLVEILAVMVIIGLVAAAVSPMMFRTIRNERLNSGCRRLASYVNELQAICAFHGRDMKLIYDIENSTYRAVAADYVDEFDDEFEDEGIIDLPDDIVFVAIALSPYDVYTYDSVEVEFRRDGWVTPHLIHLALQEEGLVERMFTLEIIPLTGQVRIHDGELDWQELML